MNPIKLKNLNNGYKNPRIEFDVSGHGEMLDTDAASGIGPSVWIHFRTGILSGGFHTDIASATALRNRLSEAIEQAKKKSQ